MKHRDFMFATSSSSIGDPPLRQYVEPNLDYLEGCSIPGCCTAAPCDVPTAADFAEVARWMDGFDARGRVIARKRGWRIPGRLRLARMRLWQAFVGLE